MHWGIRRQDIQPVRISIMPQTEVKFQVERFGCCHDPIEPGPIEYTRRRMGDIPPGCIAYPHTTRLDHQLIVHFQEFVMSNESHLILAIKEIILTSDKIGVLQERPQLNRLNHWQSTVRS